MAGIQVQPCCCGVPDVPVPSECTAMLTELIATYYRVEITGCLGEFPVTCSEADCAAFNGTYVFGPVPAGTGGTDATDPHACCVDLAFGPTCFDGISNNYDTIRLCFRRHAGGGTFETSVTFEPGCGSNTLGFYRLTAAPQDAINYTDQLLNTEVNDACCSVISCTCVITAIPPP